MIVDGIRVVFLLGINFQVFNTIVFFSIAIRTTTLTNIAIKISKPIRDFGVSIRIFIVCPEKARVLRVIGVVNFCDLTEIFFVTNLSSGVCGLGMKR